MSRPPFDSVLVITFEYAPFPGGIGTYATNTVRVLGKQHRVSVIAPAYEVSSDCSNGAAMFRLLKPMTLNLRGTFGVLSHIRKCPATTLVHCADVRSGFLGLIGRLMFGRRYSVMVHGSEVSKLNRWRAWRPDHMAVRLSYRMAERVMANSAATAAIVATNVDPSIECQVAHLGVAPLWFKPPPQTTCHPDLESALKGGRRIVCTVGRIERRKGHGDVIRALGRLQLGKSVDDWVYLIIGKVIDAEYAQELQELAREKEVAVLMTGAIDASSVRLVYSRAAMHILAAQSHSGKIEGFGLVVLEAAAQGCPSVATRCGGLPEIIEHKRTGYLVEEGDIEALGNGITFFMKNPKDGTHRKHCLEHAAAFSWEECVRRSFQSLLPL